MVECVRLENLILELKDKTMKTEQQQKDSERLASIAIVAMFLLLHMIIINQYILQIWIN